MSEGKLWRGGSRLCLPRRSLGEGGSLILSAPSPSTQRQLRWVSALPVREDDEDQQWTAVLFASDQRAIPRGAPRRNHTWEICHLAGSIRDVGPGGRRESVSGAPRRCGFDQARPLAWRQIHGWRGMVWPAWCFGERVSFGD